MKQIAVIILFLCPIITFAQEKGIHFETDLTWGQVKAKAKAENKFIFIDCYTSWCGPCKELASYVFPQEHVGAFFNKRFISVQVEFLRGRKENDNELIMSWAKTASFFRSTYGVQGYPTFLYFSPNGEIVHLEMSYNSSDSVDAIYFIEQARNALYPSNQYYTLLNRLKIDTNPLYDDVRTLAKKAMVLGNLKFVDSLIGAYLKKQKDTFSRPNLELLDISTTTTTSQFLGTYIRHGDRLDYIMGAGTTLAKLKSIALASYGMGHSELWKEVLATQPDWEVIRDICEKKYGKYAEEIFLSIKTDYLERKRK